MFDGSSTGWVILDISATSHSVISWGGSRLPDGTSNNIAEVSALLEVVTAWSKLDISSRDGLILGDSELIIHSLLGCNTLTSHPLLARLIEVSTVLRHLPRVAIGHVRRSFNSIADAVCNWILDDEPVPWTSESGCTVTSSGIAWSNPNTTYDIWVESLRVECRRSRAFNWSRTSLWWKVNFHIVIQELNAASQLIALLWPIAQPYSSGNNDGAQPVTPWSSGELYGNRHRAELLPAHVSPNKSCRNPVIQGRRRSVPLRVFETLRTLSAEVAFPWNDASMFIY